MALAALHPMAAAVPAHGAMPHVRRVRPDDARLLLTDLVETSRSMSAFALHRRARAQRAAALAALVARGFAAAESAVLRLVERLTHRTLRPSNTPV